MSIRLAAQALRDGLSAFESHLFSGQDAVSLVNEPALVRGHDPTRR